MVSFGNRDLVAFSNALARLYEVTDLTGYNDRVFEVVQQLIPGAVVSCDNHHLVSHVTTFCCSREAPSGFEDWPARVRELIPSHPAFIPIQRDPGQVIAITDCLSQRQFVQTALYADVLRPLGCAYQMVAGLQIPNHVAGVTISRDLNFRENERELINLIRPHLAQAHINAQMVSQIQQQHHGTVPGPDSLVCLGTTPRESEVLHWMMLGKRDSEIAQIVGCSLRTVHKHVTRILAKLHVETRTAAAQEASRRWRSLDLLARGDGLVK